MISTGRCLAGSACVSGHQGGCLKLHWTASVVLVRNFFDDQAAEDHGCFSHWHCASRGVQEWARVWLGTSWIAISLQTSETLLLVIWQHLWLLLGPALRNYCARLLLQDRKREGLAVMRVPCRAVHTYICLQPPSLSASHQNILCSHTSSSPLCIHVCMCIHKAQGWYR